LCGESIIVFDEIKTIWEEVVVTCFRVQSWKWLEGNEENNWSSQ